jgi:S1-C subfamily serine protease
MKRRDSLQSNLRRYPFFRRSRSAYLVIAAVVVTVAVLGLLAAGCSASIGNTTTSAKNQASTTTTEQSSALTTAGSDSSNAAGSSGSTTGGGNATSGTTTPTVKAQGQASPAESVAQVLGPSVVNIKVSGTSSGGLGRFGMPEQDQQYSAEGSGVIYRADGMIITNNHVVTDEYAGTPVSTIKVTLATGEQLDATIVGRDPLTDLAVIKVKTDKKLPAAQFVGTLPTVGEYAVAIGSPLGYENSVTLGIVSGLSREIEGVSGAEAAAYTNLIQTDAPISPGNSGGALANASGQVIGINVAYEPPSQTGAVSIGFAIPAATVTNVADQLINSGKVMQGYLGVSLYPQAVSADLQKQFSLSRDSGVLVSEVVSGTPAGKAGIQQGDIIYKLNGQTVADPSTFIAQIRDTKPGTQVELTLDRKGKEQTIKVTVGERPSTTATTSQ